MSGLAERILNAHAAGAKMKRNREMAELQDQMLEFGQTYAADPQSEAGQQAFGQLAAVNPERALQTQQAVEGQDYAEQERKFKEGQKRLDALGKMAAGILSMPEEQRQSAYGHARNFAITKMNGSPELVPEEYDEDMLRGVAAMTGNDITSEDPNKLQVFTDGEGNVYNYDSSTGDFAPVPGIKGKTASTETIEVTPGGVKITKGPGGEDRMVPPKSVRTMAGKNLVAAETSLDKMDKIFESYEPEFLTYAGKGKAWLGTEAEKLAGIPIVGDTVGEMAETLGADSEFVKRREKFRQQVEQEFNEYRRLITGAAASVQELDALRKSMFNSDQGPSEFQAAAEQYRNERQRIARISRRVLREGFEMGEEGFGQQVDKYFMNGADDNPMGRGEELEAQGYSDQEIIDTLKNEGYID